MASQPASSSSASALADDLAALQARQAALRERLSSRNARDANTGDSLDATFGRLPEYVQKLRRVQQSMDTLAIRTSQMRARCVGLLHEEKPE